MDKSIIEAYENGGAKLSQSIRGLTLEDLLSKPGADAGVGLWSIQEVVMHLMDSDLIATDRMKRVIAEDNPSLIGYSENKFVQNLFYDEQSAADAVTIFDLNRRNFAKILHKLPDSAFSRFGTHNERGRVTLDHMVRGYVDHLVNHLKFIHAKREKMGKEMW